MTFGGQLGVATLSSFVLGDVSPTTIGGGGGSDEGEVYAGYTQGRPRARREDEDLVAALLGADLL